MAHIRNRFRSDYENKLIPNFSASEQKQNRCAIRNQRAPFLLLAEAGANSLQACGAEQS
jgi:hypothetical protein